VHGDLRVVRVASRRMASASAPVVIVSMLAGFLPRSTGGGGDDLGARQVGFREPLNSRSSP
jgi:hypothetical protein